MLTLTLAAIGAAVAFAPAWDSYTLRAGGRVLESFTAGNAFSNPGLVIAGNLAVMIALVAVVIAAATWRPALRGAALLAGAVIPMAAQAISALIQVGEVPSPAQFGISAGPGSAGRRHDQHRSHRGVLGLLRVRGRAGRAGRVDARLAPHGTRHRRAASPAGFGVTQPAAGQPAAGQPAAGQPAAGQPAAGQPAATPPAATPPAATPPAAGPPAGTFS